jgi:hypothetical protein
VYNNAKTSQGGDIDEAERHLFRFDTTSQHHGSSGKWNETFTVYSCNSQIDFIVTVCDKDDFRSDFLGQIIVKADAAIVDATIRKKIKRWLLKLGPLSVEPREPSNKQPVRFSEVDRTKQFEPMGKISFELIPISCLSSKCGILEEMLSALLKGAKKKWWALLLDKQLLLFSHQGDARPKITIPLRPGTATVSWHEGVVIKVTTLENQWLFTNPNADERTSWYNRLTGRYADMVEEGKKRKETTSRGGEPKSDGKAVLFNDAKEAK